MGFSILLVFRKLVSLFSRVGFERICVLVLCSRWGVNSVELRSSDGESNFFLERNW